MNNKIVYIKPNINTIVTEKHIKLGQVMKIYSSDAALVQILKECEIIRVTNERHCKYAVSILKVIEQMELKVAGLLVLNEGDSSFVVEYQPPRRPNNTWETIKAVFIGLTVFFGAAFSIMTFNEDVSVKEVFEKVNLLVVNRQPSFDILSFSYCLGLPVGILLLFNHYSKKRMEMDPTPLQVQLRLYETDETKAIIDGMSRTGKALDVK